MIKFSEFGTGPLSGSLTRWQSKIALNDNASKIRIQINLSHTPTLPVEQLAAQISNVWHLRKCVTVGIKIGEWRNLRKLLWKATGKLWQFTGRVSRSFATINGASSVLSEGSDGAVRGDHHPMGVAIQRGRNLRKLLWKATGKLRYIERSEYIELIIHNQFRDRSPAWTSAWFRKAHKHTFHLSEFLVHNCEFALV